MSKMIDRDALADAIIKEFGNEELTHEEWRTINHILNIIADAEIATESANAIQGWIPTRKFPPEGTREVVITVYDSEWKYENSTIPEMLEVHTGYVEVNANGKRVWHWYDEYGNTCVMFGEHTDEYDTYGEKIGYSDILAWMPLPKPYIIERGTR